MKNKILVAYASSYGSTQEIAEEITKVLRGQGLAVELQRLRDVKTLDGTSAVVMGSPIYMFHLNKDALRFLSRFQRVLEGGLPVAVFAGGPTSTGDEKEWKEVQHQFDRELAKYPWFQPVSVQLVGGRFDPARLRFPYSLIPALRQMPATDLRDWATIRAWAAGLAVQLHCTSQDIQPA